MSKRRKPVPGRAQSTPLLIATLVVLLAVAAAAFLWAGDFLLTIRIAEANPANNTSCGPPEPLHEIDTPLSRCGGIAHTPLADLVSSEYVQAEELNADLVQHGVTELAASNASALPLTRCDTRTNAFFDHQQRVVFARPPPVDGFDQSQAAGVMRVLFTHAAAQWLLAAGGRPAQHFEPDAAELRVFQEPADMVIWFSMIAVDECHPAHHHVKTEGWIDAANPIVLSAVYYASARREHAPFIFGGSLGVGGAGAATSRQAWAHDASCVYLARTHHSAPDPQAAPDGDPQAQRLSGQSGREQPLARGTAEGQAGSEIRAERSERLTLRPQPGHFVVFPAWMTHGVPTWPPSTQCEDARAHQQECAPTLPKGSDSSSSRVALAANIALNAQRVQQLVEDETIARTRLDGRLMLDARQVIHSLGLPPFLAGEREAGHAAAHHGGSGGCKQ